MDASGNTVKFRFINNAGGGFAEDSEVIRNTTVGEFLKHKLGDDVEFDKYTIRYTSPGKQPDLVTKNQVIEDGSRLTCSANKIDGYVK